MPRFNISLEDDLANEFDRLIAQRGYRNRSEAEQGSHAHGYAAKQMPLGYAPMGKRDAAHLHLKQRT